MTTTHTARADRPNALTRRRMLATIVAHLGTACAACGRETVIGGAPTDGMTLNLGHVKADTNGGTWTIDNLLPACRRCNVAMGGQDWTDAGAPMLVQPLPAGTPLVADPGTREVNMERAPWQA
jgi:5-methylcytosine-specific restriction endonuclease McrA